MCAMVRQLVETESTFLQFFITTQPASWCDPLHVAFGEVVTGLEIVHMLQTCPTDGAPRGRPSKEIIIKGCGILKD
jgi:peptidyl-prolyl cis-trans isomerase B (cyclophilin B)